MGLKLVGGLLFLFLTVFGLVGNISVFVIYMCSFGGGTDKKSIQFILMHVIFTNIVILLSKGLPRTIAAFGLKNFLSDIICKIIVYMSRVARGFSICTSSLLTIVQVIIISPRASGLYRFKPRSVWHIFPLLVFFWVVNSLISINLLYIHYVPMNTSQLSQSDHYCFFIQGKMKKGNNIPFTFMVLRDVLFQGIMVATSGYMVFFLHKHHQRVLYLQNAKLLYTTPEIKAAKSVLLLMLCFLFFYWTDCFISLYLIFSLENYSITVYIQEFLTIGYAIFSPYVLIHRDGHLSGCWYTH
ncbi:putative vomeronasal receptor-like protein 4 [Dipodomys spectabilis]|uniref:putative vomeronasal receptor-like protein 4 n=1 Tax=Dipodomys spectabilis TaxID=105255 RepID=UPI001C538485|nr:putative vomeronasal receptor-like protein 4 [Dipodomys spectabilis]